MNPIEGTKRFPCAQCGAQLAFRPGTVELVCEYCGFQNQIEVSTDQVEELDYHVYLDVDRQAEVSDHEQTVKCNACAAQFTVGGRTTADRCPFCGSNTIVPMPDQVRIRPQCILPFLVDAKKAKAIYDRWIGSHFWAPNALKHYARADNAIKGMYLPYWTYDSSTTSDYHGERGEYYYETETYTEYVNGEPETRTRQVRRTRWYPASGTVYRDFDDVMVPGSTTLPNNHVLRIETWDVNALISYREEFLSGFNSERYNIGLESGFQAAQDIMRRQIYRDVEADIGGDEQRIHNVDTQHDNVTFKHMLVPIWLGAYKFRDKTYRFFINGRTGDISGDAPISPWKVAIAVLLVILIIVAFMYFNRGNAQ